MAVTGVTPELLAWAFHRGGFSGCRARPLGRAGLSVPGLGPQRSRPVGSSAGAVARVVELRRGVCDLPGVPCVARQTLNHWITGEAVLGFLSSRW